ncbi:aspartate racemase [Kerstersia gyiorum]|uniref:Aspartate racemase n=1 Tax=Kerstersia gyiorum TaxID=206506 RepID=A0A4Q7MBX8_9BURK|nr:aspartate/glutamate racemase family protein [Kerstersia gyiorum]KAB0542147.1 aspartate/glutamate racemase family protein [Kerstersia gyiorum]RZS64887.1 aspartate racemase [Kerstersia gyiorum]
MKTLGLIGGMSWESTVPYYRHINQTIQQRMGGLHSARIVLWSVDFHEIEQLQHAGQWDAAGAMLAEAAQRLEDAGAEALVLCTNTMHKVAAQIEAATRIPLLHIADPTASAIRAAGLERVGLLGTRFTMEQEFYRARLLDQHGLHVLVPDEADRATVHRVIYDELCQGQVRDASRQAYLEVIERLMQQGAQGIILGCTEISLLIEPQHVRVQLFDTTALHATHAANWALDSMP